MRRNFSIALKAILALCAGLGIVLTMTNGHDGHIRWSYLLYFTIQSNIWVMLLAIAGIFMMLKKRESERAWSILDLVVTVAITLTGFVYCFVLAPTIENPFRIDSVLVHVCSPLIAIADYLVCGGMLNLKGRDSYWSIIPPFYYLIFASIGHVCNWPFSATTNYPYFFLNWGSPMGAFGIGSEFPFMGVMWYVLCIIIFLVLISRLYILIAKRIGK